MYPKVKVRVEQYEEDHSDLQNQNLKSLESLSIHGSRFPVRNQNDVSQPTTAKVPKCYVPHGSIIPRVPVSENLELSSLTSDFSDKDGNSDDDKVNIRFSSIPRPRAVVSSPDNDEIIGKKKSIKDGRLSASKNRSVLQNRQAPCRVKSSSGSEIPPRIRVSGETAGSTKIAPIRTNTATKAASNQKIYIGTGSLGA